jgi:hypothetical protein
VFLRSALFSNVGKNVGTLGAPVNHACAYTVKVVPTNNSSHAKEDVGGQSVQVFSSLFAEGF